MNSNIKSDLNELDVAVIGMSCRFPGASTVEQFWENLQEARESISRFDDEELIEAGVDPQILAYPEYVKAGAALEGIDLFDAPFFGFTPREAEITDPQHRLFLECAWEALENAGYDTERVSFPIAIYAGVGINNYLINVYSNAELLKLVSRSQIVIANDKDFLATKVAYRLNLRGPAVTVQTACSTSLVAVHLARNSLLNGEAEIALAGGATVAARQKTGYAYVEGGINSPDGHCRAFDAAAGGTVSGNGVGIVVLKRLTDAVSDRDTIHAVIKGSAVNNDGSHKIGYSAPGVSGQAEVIRAALLTAEIDPSSVSYIEAHGTGTPLGDPIELAALAEAYGSNAGAYKRRIGSVKTNIGHLDTAAGVAGLIKTIEALKRRMIPPSLHFKTPNPQIDFDKTNFVVNHQLVEWTRGETPRRAGVSSFGIGGTNAHVVLEEAPEMQVEASERRFHLLALSAKTSDALRQYTLNLAEYLKKFPDAELADVAFTLQTGRREFAHRTAVLSRNVEEALCELKTLTPNAVRRQSGASEITFLIPGQGSQYAGMGREIYRSEKIFRDQINQCSEILGDRLGFPLRALFHSNAVDSEYGIADLTQTAIGQPALFAFEYALAKLWMKWGLRPAAMIGHSLGEYVAACLAGVMSLESGLGLVALRGQLMQQLPEGRMLAVDLDEGRLCSLVDGQVSIAAVNAPSRCVISGPIDAMEAIEERLREMKVGFRSLNVSKAFHSQTVTPVLEPFGSFVGKLNLKAPEIPFLSNVTGSWISDAEAADPNYWARHLRQTVRFSQCVDELLKSSAPIFLEVGPGQNLTALVRRRKDRVATAIPSLGSNPEGEEQALLSALGKLWVSGVKIDWSGFWSGESRRRIPLPTYPFERRRFWLDLPAQTKTASASPKGERPQTAANPVALDQDSEALPPPISPLRQEPRNKIEAILAGIWEQALGITRIGIHDDFFEIGGDSLAAIRILSAIKEKFPVDLTLQGMLSSPTIAELSVVIQGETALSESFEGRKQPSNDVGYYCAFELQMGDSPVTVYMTEADYAKKKVPEEAMNFRLL